MSPQSVEEREKPCSASSAPPWQCGFSALSSRLGAERSICGRHALPLLLRPQQLSQPRPLSRCLRLSGVSATLLGCSCLGRPPRLRSGAPPAVLSVSRHGDTLKSKSEIVERKREVAVRKMVAADALVVGNNNLIMGSCHIAHDCNVGNVILANNTLRAGHVVVEDYAHTAGAVVVHQFCHVGSFAFIGGGSVIAQDVPKFMMVAGERAQLCGLNLEGLQRHGFIVTEIRSLRKAYQKIFMPADANYSGFEARLAEVELHDELAHIPAVYSMVQSIRDSFKEKRLGLCKFKHWNSS